MHDRVALQKLERGVQVVSSTTPAGATVRCILTDSAVTPEDNAMLQALYSRSKEGMLHHLQKVLKTGSGRFIEVYYVGYGDKSIGDCGSLTVFIEGVSMLVAKALQHTQLYNGQEQSTRFIDYGTVPFITPFSPDPYALWEWGHTVLKGWRDLYQALYPAVLARLSEQHPPDSGTEVAVHKRAVKARALDICRGLLPAGASTGLSWHGSISTFSDRLPELKVHPLPEVQEVAQSLEDVLSHAFEHSFPRRDQEHLEQYYAKMPVSDTYHHDWRCPSFEATDGIDQSVFSEPFVKELRCPLPNRYKEGGTIEMRFLLDYGSYRDIARHRAVWQRLPVLTMDLGMHPWYLEQLLGIDGADGQIEGMIHKTSHLIKSTLASSSPEKELLAQYFIPMGFQVSCKLTGNLWALAYLVELRCSSKVHPTLVKLVLQMRDVIAPYVTIQHEENPLRFNPRRGKDTITEK